MTLPGRASGDVGADIICKVKFDVKDFSVGGSRGSGATGRAAADFMWLVGTRRRFTFPLSTSPAKCKIHVAKARSRNIDEAYPGSPRRSLICETSSLTDARREAVSRPTAGHV